MEKLNEFFITILQIEKTMIFLESKDLQKQFLESIQKWIELRSNNIEPKIKE
jgi:hypothetical protein